MQQWIIFAIIAMVVFSFSNLALKNVTSKLDFNAFKPLLLPAVIAILIFVLGALYVLSKQPLNVPNNLLLLIGGVVICSVVGFILFIKALESGDVAIVTAILSLSTVVVAILSVFIFGTKYALKEIAAIALAVISLLILIL